MLQIVGRTCVKCQKMIRSVVEGGFCERCAGPIHEECREATGTTAPERCSTCGADPNSEVAKQVRAEMGQRDEERFQDASGAIRKEGFDKMVQGVLLLIGGLTITIISLIAGVGVIAYGAVMVGAFLACGGLYQLIKG